jgi:hypothetical protein
LNLPGHETLLAVGVSLIMLGVVMRGLAANVSRDLARRKQHRLDARKTSEAKLNEELEHSPGWLEKNLGMIANIALLVGVGLTIAGYWRL